MYQIITKESIPSIFLNQNLRLSVLPREGTNKGLGYWDDLQEKYIKIGEFPHLAYLENKSLLSADDILVNSQLVGSLHAIPGATMYFELPAFPKIGKLHFGKIKQYAWNEGKEWEEGMIKMKLHPFFDVTCSVIIDSKIAIKLLKPDIGFLDQKDLLRTGCVFTASIKKYINPVPPYYLNFHNGEEPYEFKTAIETLLEASYLGRELAIAVQTAKNTARHDIGVMVVEKDEAVQIGAFTTAPKSKDSLIRLREAGIVRYESNGSESFIARILRPEVFDSVKLFHSGKDYKLKLSSQVSINRSSDGSAAFIPPILPGINISAKSDDYLGRKIAIAIGKQYNLQRDRDLTDTVHDVFKANYELIERIKISGGLKWLKSCFNASANSEFSGLGQDSKLIQAIMSGYKLSS
jgi:hypothetical protein